MIKNLKYIVFIFFLQLTFNGWAQLNVSEKRVLKKANGYFNQEEFDKALPLFLKLDSIDNDYTVKYRIGACYLNTKYDRLKAIPFLEDVSNTTSIEIPLIVHYDLGVLYHYTYRFAEAIIQFNEYIKKSKYSSYVEEETLEESRRMIIVCENAIKITALPFKAEIDILGHPINTMESEYCPMITADNQTLVYMRKVGLGKLGNPKILIMTSKRVSATSWGKPEELLIDNSNKFAGKTVSLAGLSSDGQTIFLNIGRNLDQDIYIGRIEDKTITKIKKLNKNINSSYYEGRVSLSSDGTELYFVSDRPGGYGGTDIYKSNRNRKGDWGESVNIGKVINTIHNENSPFMHPDNITLFFSSEGHKTIGGNDIFKSTFKEKWSEPENLGFPNSTKDDLYFVLNANGQMGYFSTSKNNIYDKHNIFKVNFKDPIPLTLVKGVIKVGNPPKPADVDIKVYDKETGIRVKYVYDPAPETGEYLMIFPPAKNYDIVISSDKYLTQLVNIFIPYQTYFYELYQEIILEPIHINNTVVGEKVTVNNTFYDLYKTAEADSIIPDDLPKQPLYYDHLLELIENIIQTTDTIQINYVESDSAKEQEKDNIESLLSLIEEAIETSDPVTLSILDANARQKDKIKESHFYVNGDKSKSLQMQIIGEDTLYTAPPIITKPVSASLATTVKKTNTEAKKETNFKSSDVLQRNYIHNYIIYYDVSEYKVPTSSLKELEEISQILINNSNLGVEIYGFTDSQGEKRYNMSLSRQRAQRVLKYFINNNVERQKVIAKAYGEAASGSDDTDSKYHRKVEINIFEIKK